MLRTPNRHMVLAAANIFVAAADLSIGGPFTQLASEAIKSGHIVSVLMLFRGWIQNKKQAQTIMC